MHAKTIFIFSAQHSIHSVTIFFQSFPPYIICPSGYIKYLGTRFWFARYILLLHECIIFIRITFYKYIEPTSKSSKIRNQEWNHQNELRWSSCKFIKLTFVPSFLDLTLYKERVHSLSVTKSEDQKQKSKNPTKPNR